VIVPYDQQYEYSNQFIGTDDSESGYSWEGSADGPWYWTSFDYFERDYVLMIRGEAEYCVEAPPTTTTTTTTTPPTTTTTTVTTTTTTTTTTTPSEDDDVDDDDADDDADDDIDDVEAGADVEEQGFAGGSCNF
jgi:hypothetical protein